MAVNIIGAGSGISKTTPQASIIVNSLVDTDEIYIRGRNDPANPPVYSTNATEADSVFQVKRGELVLTKRQQAVANIVRKEGVAPSLRVLSSLNGLVIKGYDRTLSAELKDMILWAYARRHLWFVGTAQGDKTQDMIHNGSVSIAVRVSGSDTIINSGMDAKHNDTIYPGDSVAWRMPSPGVGAFVRSGEPKGKMMPVVYKYKPYERMAELVNMLKRMTDTDLTKLVAADDSFAEYVDFMKKAPFQGMDVKDLVQLTKLLMFLKAEFCDSMVIGKALSEAAPGQPFDILLRHGHTTA